MRISVLYSKDAGDGIPLATLRREIENHGHHAAHIVEQATAFKDSLADGVDLAVAAGGDGTVRRAALALAGTSIPLAILPFGTANNIARSLHLSGDVERQVASWANGERKRIDLGVAEGPFGSCSFIESTGAGLLVEGMRMAHGRTDHADDADIRLTAALDAFVDALQSLKPVPSTLVLDGQRVVGSFLMIEAMNTGAAGPQLDLAPDADLTDGWLTVVTAEEAQREELSAYLSARAGGTTRELRLPARRARRIEASGWNAVHVDDRILDGLHGHAVTVSLASLQLEVLVEAR